MLRPLGEPVYDAGVPQPPKLTLVPRIEPSSKERVRTRVKRTPRPDGMLQCPVCGGRTAITTRNGVIIKDGKVKDRGTLIEKDMCSVCWPKRVMMWPGGLRPKPIT